MRLTIAFLRSFIFCSLSSLSFGTTSFTPGLYWTDGSSIHYADINAANTHTVATGFTAVSNLFVDLGNQYIYFIDRDKSGSGGKLYRLNSAGEAHLLNALQPLNTFTLDPASNTIYYERIVQETIRELYHYDIASGQSQLIKSNFLLELIPLSDMYFDASTREIVTLGFVTTASLTPDTLVKIQKIDMQGTTKTIFVQSTFMSHKPESFDYDPHKKTYYFAERRGKAERPHHPDCRGIWSLDDSGLKLVGQQGIPIHDVKCARDIIFYSTPDGIGFMDTIHPQRSLLPNQFIASPAKDMVVILPDTNHHVLWLGLFAILSGAAVNQR